jgi:hypothetical protein
MFASWFGLTAYRRMNGATMSRRRKGSTTLRLEILEDRVVPSIDTTTTLASSANPSTSGNSVALTATVSPSSGSSGTPTGTVEFYDGTTPLGYGTLSAEVVADQATIDVPNSNVPNGLADGAHEITAVYNPAEGSNFNPSYSTTLNQVVKFGTTTTVAPPGQSIHIRPERDLHRHSQP